MPERFQAATGIEVEVALHATSEIRGKVVAGGGKDYDVLFVSSPFAEALNQFGLAAGMLARGHSVNETDQRKIDQIADDLISAKKNLLAYDDTTFYSELVSGEASLVHAWDGWCNYGTACNAEIKYIIPKEGADLRVDTLVIAEASENKAAAHAIINFVLGKETGDTVRHRSFHAMSVHFRRSVSPATIEFPMQSA